METGGERGGGGDRDVAQDTVGVGGARKLRLEWNTGGGFAERVNRAKEEGGKCVVAFDTDGGRELLQGCVGTGVGRGRKARQRRRHAPPLA
jgi:hypothetical protein